MDSLVAANAGSGGTISQSLDTVIDAVCPGIVDYLPEFMAFAGEFMAAGVLLALIIWALGFAVRTVFGWLDEWGRG